MDDQPRFLTPQELVARYRGTVTKSTLANWRSAGIGPPFVRVGGKVLYDLADVEKWEAERRVTPTATKGV